MIAIAHGSCASSSGGSHDHYCFFNKNSHNSVKRWTKDDKHYSSKKCTHCGRRGHTIDECHHLHGFPPNYYKKRKSSVNNVTIIKISNESETLTNQEESQ